MTSVPDFLYWYKARCLKVVDGDTIDVITDLGFRMTWGQRVRLYGLNAYELSDQDAAKRALASEGKAFAAARVQDKDIVLNTFKDRTEKYGRWLAVVHYLGGEGTWHNLNEELVAAGLAVPMSY